MYVWKRAASLKKGHLKLNLVDTRFCVTVNVTTASACANVQNAMQSKALRPVASLPVCNWANQLPLKFASGTQFEIRSCQFKG